MMEIIGCGMEDRGRGCGVGGLKRGRRENNRFLKTCSEYR
jgi:hypothetical protein